jgi:hypothetical protein
VHQAVLGLAAAPAVPVGTTFRIVEDGTVRETPARESLFAMQTPQAFRAELHQGGPDQRRSRPARSIRTTAPAVEALGVPVRLSRGSAENLKITTIEDLDTRAGHPGAAGRRVMRIGHGYDVHRLVPGRKLILGGVLLPFGRGLLGHSDADVLTHAVMDALLGAAALGDIGSRCFRTATRRTRGRTPRIAPPRDGAAAQPRLCAAQTWTARSSRRPRALRRISARCAATCRGLRHDGGRRQREGRRRRWASVSPAGPRASRRMPSACSRRKQTAPQPNG